MCITSVDDRLQEPDSAPAGRGQTRAAIVQGSHKILIQNSDNKNKTKQTNKHKQFVLT